MRMVRLAGEGAEERGEKKKRGHYLEQPPIVFLSTGLCKGGRSVFRKACDILLPRVTDITSSD